MRLTTLGTAGWVPTARRETTCLALKDGVTLIVFDAGTGLRRLLAPVGQNLLAGVEAVDLVLTHYHLDHVCGLAYLPAVLAGRRLTVHAPAAAVNGTDPERALSELIRPPYNPGPWSDWPDITVRALEAGDNEVAGHLLRLRAQKHPGTSAGYRLDDLFALATDTGPDPETETFAHDVAVLAHECWYNDDDPATRRVHGSLLPSFRAHSEVGEVAALAARTAVGRLLLMHLNPLFGEEYYGRMRDRARRGFADTLLVPDETEIDLASPA
ncbi:MAG: MBL fold metallo-hydrolase [Thermoleophilia bacterium]|nr:MBL fold metallo-hydrolase [Thermoleophilia bacterium]